MRCLIADDRPEAEVLWRAAMRRAGWSGVLARTTEDARIALGGAAFDLAIVDMMLEHGRGPIVVDAAADEGVSVLLMADDTVLCSGLPLALAPSVAKVVPRALTLAEAGALLQNHADRSPAVRLRAIRIPELGARLPVAHADDALASTACRSGSESGKASQPLHPANRSAPFWKG